MSKKSLATTRKTDESNESPIEVKFLRKNWKLQKDCFRGYTLNKYLARGGSATVYQVCNLKNNCEYVVKIQKLMVKSGSFVENWVREACMTKILSYEFDIG